jgi:putative transposase
MTNHIHLIAQSSKGDLSGTLRDFRKFTSSTINEAIQQNKEESRKNWMLWVFRKAGEKNSRNKDYQFWQQDNQPIQFNYHTIYLRQTQLHSQQPCKSRNSRKT